MLSLRPRDAAALDAFTSEVRRVAGDSVREIKLFGSKAAGTDSPESDIDVLVVIDEANPDLEDRIIDIAFDVNLAHEVYISPRVIPGAILEHPVWRITPFLQSVRQQGIPI